jgi:uncharacterized lipoprotein YajG
MLFRSTLLIALLLSTGCTTHHKVFLDPSLPIHDSKIGNNNPVSLYVEDTRRSNIIAKWHKGIRKFSISAQNDLKDIFSAKIQHGLKKLGFIPKGRTRNPNHSLKVDILNIKSKYKVSSRMNVRVKTSLRATCHNNGRKYSKLYSARKSRIGITPATFPNENLLNASLSELLGEMFRDKALLSCLVGLYSPTNNQINY